MNDPNYGAKWLRANGKEVSAFGERVANLLDRLFAGIYHIGRECRKADFSREWAVAVTVNDSRFATWDFDLLTKLVILCHDMCIRCEVQAVSPWGYIRLCFHPREREGCISQRHPTIEEAIERTRRPLI